MFETLVNSANPGAVWVLPFGAFFGAVGFVLGLWLRNKTKRFLQAAVETTGTYVKAVRQSSGTSERSSTSYGVVEFETEDGETIHYTTMSGVPWASRLTGKEVTVLYDPVRPEIARLNSFVELTLPWLIFLLVGGGILLSIGGVALIFLLGAG